MLSSGAAAQKTPIGAEIWQHLDALSEDGHEVHLQWVPAHCGIVGNERADELAKEAAAGPQVNVPADVCTLVSAVCRTSTRKWQEACPDSLFKRIFRGHLPLPIAGDDRKAAVSVHQLRAGHWGFSRQYLHRIGRHPSPECGQCSDKSCPAALCAVCREEADTPEHVLLRCPCTAGTRLLRGGNIYTDPTKLRDADLVAALAASYQRHMEPLGYGPP